MSKFKLSQAEQNLLNFVRQHQQAIFSGLISTIAVDRLKYDVNEYTKFDLSEDMSEMTITQLEPKTDTDQAIKAA